MITGSPAEFGGRARAQAASQIITLAVQQAISSLPPASGQTAAYTYDPKTDAYAVSRKPGPVVFRTPTTIGKGRVGLRVATSYFELDESFGPADYVVRDPHGRSSDSYTRFGLRTKATAGVISFAADYGLTQAIQLSFTVPVTIVDASAQQAFPSRPSSGNVAATVGFNLIDDLVELGDLVERTESIDTADARFESGTQAGVGRISVGGKMGLGSFHGLEGALGLEFFCPSPSEAQFAGSASPALLGRLIGGYRLANFLFLADVGYDYDFDVAELRRLVWDTGVSAQFPSFTFDVGLGGSLYDQGIEWTPAVASGPRSGTYPDGSVIEASGGNRLGTDLVQFLGSSSL